jgi:NADH dehydrogenase
VVIVGAGFGGLEAARALSKSEVDITLIDRRNFHLFQPLLYQVATAALSPGDIAWPTRSIFKNRKNVNVLMADITGVDTAARTVTDGVAVIPYDFLIVATGAAHSYFGHDEWSQFAPALKTIDDALKIRQRLLLAFERAELSTDPDERKSSMTTVIVGGGATGVEMAGAIAELAHRTLRGEFRRIEPENTRILLIEAGPRILPTFPAHMSEIARVSLQTMGVEIHTGLSVTDCNARGVVLSDGGHIDAVTVIWAAGVAASPAATWLGAARDRAGRVEVMPNLTVRGFPEIYVIGDTATVRGTGERPVPGVAPAAKQMGRYVGKVLAARLIGREIAVPFVYRNQGDLAAVGHQSALVSLGRFELSGFIGWLFWCVAHIWFLIGFRSRVVVTFSWVWSYLTFKRSARLISDRD